MSPLKADLHIHTAEDPKDLVRYTATELIDMAHARGYAVLSITNHNAVTYSPYLADYARERGIVLIPGMELSLHGRHILLYNFDFDAVSLSSWRHLYALDKSQGLIIAPHPFFPGTFALRGLLRRHVTLFDALEFCHCYSRNVNFNVPAIRFAKRRNLPLVGTSDAHQRRQFHTTFSLIDAEPDPQAVMEAVKAGRVQVVSRPLTLSLMASINMKLVFRNKVLKPAYEIQKELGPYHKRVKKRTSASSWRP